MEVAVTKDGTAFVTNQGDGTVSVIPAGANNVSRTIQVSSNPGKTESGLMLPQAPRRLLSGRTEPSTWPAP